MPVITRWGTSIDAAIYYSTHFDKIKTIVYSFDSNDSENIRLAQETLNSSTIKRDLAYIQANFSCIVTALTKLQCRGVTLNESIETFEVVGRALNSLRDKKYLRKYENLVEKNSGFSALKIIRNIINGDNVNTDLNQDFINSFSPIEINALQFAPVTSSDVERSFSVYKHILNEKRRSFTFENLKKHVIVNCNKI